MSYTVSVTRQAASTVGINLKEDTTILSDTFDIKDKGNIKKIHAVAERQWDAERDRAQLRRKNSGAWLEDLLAKSKS
jgi:hypothetical protein